MYRAGLESILGLRRRGESFEIDPCIPQAWPGFRLTWRFGATRYAIEVANPEGRARGVAEALLDGTPVDPRAIPLKDDGGRHELKVLLGERVLAATPS
jgi:cyclic beta-1,2-glucan synthetase